MHTFETNSSFSREIPGLQIAVDSTGLGEFKTCPRKYYYSQVLGYLPREGQVHLVFGQLLHRAREIYDHQRAQGATHDQALDATLQDALRATWNRALARPWISNDPIKNRATLLRAIVWYLDQFEHDSFQTLILANGKPAVELSFAFDSGYKAISGEEILLCGHMDRLVENNGETYVADIKTTKYALDPKFFDSFTPDNQFSLYVLASKVAFAKPASGLILDAIQVGVNFVRCQRAPIPRSRAAIDEWFQGLGFWLGQMSECATKGQWPMNDKACNLYGGCRFRPVCARPPGAREEWLRVDYEKRNWDPLKARGDV